ncbi:spermidine/putrescine transport system ATP-binding protein [Bacilli bacterium PM5-3]|nr:spermidine/putrescine transport system ATP-binding protein [Bacilli bacterium PM5-3]MDH6603804.1 spermidine/putrescine transport system ATP-binding protein [Bacilli bacterium PM5-9]
MKKLIELKNISKSYDENEILKDFNLYINENEFITLVGPSGCGKTTLLRIIGGFESVDEGQVIFDDKDITKLEANERKINTVFQKYALFPHLNVYDNVAFGLRMKKKSEEEIEKLIDWALKLTNLEKMKTRSIDSLSGGQQQRVAIARAIVNKPKVLLLDEPLGALDLKLRQNMQYELKELQKDLEITFVFVTHDQEEALSMSDTVVVLNDGAIQQIGTPEDIYNEPKNRFVANFIGESNIIEGRYLGNKQVEFEGAIFDCVDTNFIENEICDVVIRPEDFDVVDFDKAKIGGEITDKVFKGVHYEFCLDINGKEYIVHAYEDKEVGEKIGLSVDPFEIHLMKVNNNETA